MSEKCPECGKNPLVIIDGLCVYCWRDKWSDQLIAQAKQIEDLKENINVQQRQHECVLNDLQGERDHLIAANTKARQDNYGLQEEWKTESDRAELAEAGCVAMREAIGDAMSMVNTVPTGDWGERNDMAGRLRDLYRVPHPGQALAAWLAELERLDAAVKDDKLAARVVAKARNNPTQYPEMDAIRDYRAGLNAAKENPDA